MAKKKTAPKPAPKTPAQLEADAYAAIEAAKESGDAKKVEKAKADLAKLVQQ